jgi:hypothetical protein
MKDLGIGVSAYELPANRILVTGSVRESRPLFVDLTGRKVEKRSSRKKGVGRMYDHWRHPREQCYDPEIRIDVPGDLARTPVGVPVVAGPVGLRMSVAPQDRRFMLDQRFEVVFYVDFVFVYEEELGYEPFTWIWNPEGVNTGFHYLTVMLRGYEGHFGTATCRVWVPPGSKP